VSELEGLSRKAHKKSQPRLIRNAAAWCPPWTADLSFLLTTPPWSVRDIALPRHWSQLCRDLRQDLSPRQRRRPSRPLFKLQPEDHRWHVVLLHGPLGDGQRRLPSPTARYCPGSSPPRPSLLPTVDHATTTLPSRRQVRGNTPSVQPRCDPSGAPPGPTAHRQARGSHPPIQSCPRTAAARAHSGVFG
jgi:hypothetical protein